jgi:hydroxymethylpyrimidine pyrophosphatase-like HAD family hydrolase
VKVSALALDYDGTIARQDALDPEVRDAVGELRARGITVVLATGRILDDLRRAAADLRFVDAIVAENGAVLEFPHRGYSAALAPPPPQDFLDALDGERIPFGRGISVVGTDAVHAPQVRSIIQRLDLPLAISFNGDAAMILPQGIGKATGLGEALRIMKLSPRRTVAIGNGENDHDLLRCCGLGVAVAWGCESLKRAADHVLPGTGPEAVASYIRELASPAG